MAAITREELLRLARTGAVARVKELQAELDTIYGTFPDLKSAKARSGARSGASAPKRRARKSASSRGWSAADRKAVSDRMKKYWATRKAKASKGAK